MTKKSKKNKNKNKNCREYLIICFGFILALYSYADLAESLTDSQSALWHEEINKLIALFSFFFNIKILSQLQGKFINPPKCLMFHNNNVFMTLVAIQF